MVAVLGNKRRVASAETNRGAAVILAVGDTKPTGVERTVEERGACRKVVGKCEENRGRIHGRGLEVEVDRTGGGGGF